MAEHARCRGQQRSASNGVRRLRPDMTPREPSAAAGWLDGYRDAYVLLGDPGGTSG